MSDATDPLTAQMLTVREQVMGLMQLLVRDGTIYETSAGKIARFAHERKAAGTHHFAQILNACLRFRER